MKEFKVIPETTFIERREKIFENFTPKEIDFINYYVNAGAGNLNPLMIRQILDPVYFKKSTVYDFEHKKYMDWYPSFTNRDYDEDISLLRKVTNYSLSENTVLFRGIRSSEVEYLLNNNHWISAVSTSVNDSVTRNFANFLVNNEDLETEQGPGYYVTILANKGVKGLYIGERSDYPGNQFEFVLRPGTKFRVIEKDDSNLTMVVEAFSENTSNMEIESSEMPKVQLFDGIESERLQAEKERIAEQKKQEHEFEKEILRMRSAYVGKKINSRKNGIGTIVDVQPNLDKTKAFLRVSFANGSSNYEESIVKTHLI